MVVTTDLVTDQRVHKVCTSLQQAGHELTLVGRRRKNSLPLEKRSYPAFRLHLTFEKGPLFYANVNIRFFFYLLFKKADVFVANDLDTLLGVFLAARLRGKQIVLDNHEYFTGMPELLGRPRTKAVWKAIERWIFPKLKYVSTDTEAKQELFIAEYQVPVKVVRNVPLLQKNMVLPEVPLFPANKKILVYQGAGINVDRGTEELTEAMQFLDDSYLLVFIGSGDVIDILKQKVQELNLATKVQFIDKVPFSYLHAYTRQAHLGLTLDKPVSENYTCSMPNKLFDYVHAGVPVLASRLREIERMINRYEIGTFIESYEPIKIAEKIKSIFDTDQISIWKKNLEKAAAVVNWQQEEITLRALYSEIEAALKK
jgi:glycosyltransferase involved in cell wall biosynthesis